MENTHILNLNSEVPFDIRLAVYEKDLENRINNRSISGMTKGAGLCLTQEVTASVTILLTQESTSLNKQSLK